MTKRAVFEVNAFVQLKDDRGHRHFLGPGKDLPDWVPDEQVQSLLKSGAITRFEVI